MTQRMKKLSLRMTPYAASKFDEGNIHGKRVKVHGESECEPVNKMFSFEYDDEEEQERLNNYYREVGLVE